MSKKQWAFRIRHIRESVDEIIGEASSAVPDEIKQNYPSIPWSKLKGLRNFLAHQYDEVLEKVLWNTISLDIPKLQEQLSMITIEREKSD